MRRLAFLCLVTGCHDFDALTCPGNLLENGTFEGPSTFGWAPYNATLSTTDDAHGGATAAHLCQTTGPFFTLNPQFTLPNARSAGDRFRVSAFVRSTVAGQVLRLFFREGDTGVSVAAITATGTWQHLEGSYAVEANEHKLEFYLSAEPAMGTDCLDVDDVCLVAENAP